jgi:branched-chain amino acid transport system ATP-binding protein
MFRHAPVRHSWVSEEEAAERTATRLLDFLKLNNLTSKPSYTLSGGQMKLLEAGRALMSGAKLILMDEPVAGINPVLAHEVLAQLRTLTRELHVTLVLVEHRLDIALQYVDYVYAMSHGRVVAAGEPKEVMENPSVLESYIGGAEKK